MRSQNCPIVISLSMNDNKVFLGKPVETFTRVKPNHVRSV